MEKIAVQNLKCGGCANTIQQKLGAITYVDLVEVDKDESIVSVTLSDQTKLEEVKSLLSKLGYPEEHEANTITKKAKSYVSCAVGRMS